jgi:hypothetical protein
MQCPDCQTPFVSEDKFCSKCGADIEAIYILNPVCPECRKEFPDGTRFCDVDSTQLVPVEKMTPRCVICNKEYPEEVSFCSKDGGDVIPEALRKVRPKAFDAGSTLKKEELDKIGNAKHNISIGQYIKEGWKIYRSNTGEFIGFTFLFCCFAGIPHFFPGIGNLIGLLLLAPLSAGFLIVAFKIINKKETEFTDFFKGLSYFLPFLLFSIVGGVLTGVGYLALVVPGIYLTICFWFVPAVIIDIRADFSQSMLLSFKKVNANFLGILGLWLTLVAINFLGVLAVGIGVLITIPLTMCITASAYQDIFGLRSDDY